MPEDKDLLKDISDLQNYYSNNPSLKFQNIDEAMKVGHNPPNRIPQLLSGSEATDSTLGVTFPMLLAGVLQSDLIKQYNTGKMKAADIQKAAFSYKEKYPNLHDTFVGDVLRHIGYRVKFNGGDVSPEPEVLPQSFFTDSFDPSRG